MELGLPISGPHTNVGPIYMVSIMSIKNGIKESTCGYQNCNTSQLLIFGGYVKVRESLYTRAIGWVNTIMNHIDTRVVSYVRKFLHIL